MIIIKSDQAEYIITSILEAISENDDIRAEILEELEINEDTLLRFIENVEVSCDDVRCD